MRSLASLLVVVSSLAVPSVAAGQSACPFSVTDALSASDASIPGARLFRDDPASTCAASTNCTPVSAGPFLYKTYTFTNQAPGTSCVTVTITPNCAGGNSVQVAAYSGSFDPNNTCGSGSNYLADSGLDLTDGVTKTFSFNVLTGATFVVVVNGTSAPNSPCAAYTLEVANCATPVALSSFAAE